MGHVDHGKTSLLDAIRKTHVTAREAGGITQHIGAYTVTTGGKKITFLDTPGHEAFTAMRARGAQCTDISVLVVAADDGVMPQTVEAINHSKAAGVPIIVAINKMDKPAANPEHVKQQLSEMELIPEDWGGDTIMVPVSAHSHQGIDDLLEMILLVAEVKELKANPKLPAHGTIVEAKLDKGRGPVATVLVQRGTLTIGDYIIAGTAHGRVRALINDRGEKVRKAGPSTPVEVLGLNEVPQAGDILDAADEKIARGVAEKRIAKAKAEQQKAAKVSLDDIFSRIKEGELKELNIVVKADVQGSVEALCASLVKIQNEEVKVSVVHSGVGAINESDVMLASAANALIIGFNVRPDANARRVADTEDVDIRTYRVIYDALNDVKDAMSGMLKPKYKEVVQGRVEIRQVMKFSKALVAGSYVLEGKIHNNSKIRIIRDNIEVFDGEIDSLRRFKDEVKEVAAGYECGISIIDYRDFKEGDIIEAYTMEEIATDINEANKEAARKRQAEAEARAAKENEE
jgi:translation initiation factor IF-2